MAHSALAPTHLRTEGGQAMGLMFWRPWATRKGEAKGDPGRAAAAALGRAGDDSGERRWGEAARAAANPAPVGNAEAAGAAAAAAGAAAEAAPLGRPVGRPLVGGAWGRGSASRPGEARPDGGAAPREDLAADRLGTPGLPSAAAAAGVAAGVAPASPAEPLADAAPAEEARAERPSGPLADPEAAGSSNGSSES